MPKGPSGQHGFTILELLVGISVMAMVVTVLASGVFQAFRDVTFQRTGLNSMDDNRRMLLVLTRDLRVATATNLVNGANPVSTVTITSKDPQTSATHTTIYSLSGTNLVRQVDGVTGIAGRNVTAVGFSASGSLFTVTLTSTTEGNTSSAVTSTWNVYKRPTS